MKRTYQRSQILSFYDLTVEQQQQVISETEGDENDSYVLWNDEPLCLSNFIVCKSSLFHAAYSLSAFSAYLIRINRTNEAATVVYAHW